MTEKFVFLLLFENEKTAMFDFSATKFGLIDNAAIIIFECLAKGLLEGDDNGSEMDLCRFLLSLCLQMEHSETRELSHVNTVSSTLKERPEGNTLDSLVTPNNVSFKFLIELLISVY